jgi:hypothetical protein
MQHVCSAAPDLPRNGKVACDLFSQATLAKALPTNKYRREDLNLHDLAVTGF